MILILNNLKNNLNLILYKLQKSKNNQKIRLQT